VQVKLTVTAELFQPLAFGCGEMAAVIAGGVFAMFKVTRAEFVLFAASVTVPETTCPAPSVAIVCGEAQLVIGAIACVQVKFTVTLVLFQPCEFAVGEAEATMDGSVSSTLSVTLAGADVLPARSVAVPETT
jgi:hypothetical protein